MQLHFKKWNTYSWGALVSAVLEEVSGDHSDKFLCCKRRNEKRRNKKILKDHRTYVMADFQLWENIQAFCRPREDVINDMYRNNLLQNAFHCDEFSSSVGGYICKWSRILVQTWCPEVARVPGSIWAHHRDQPHHEVWMTVLWPQQSEPKLTGFLLIYRLSQTKTLMTKLIENLSGKYFGAAVLLHFSTSIDKVAEARKQTEN